eukprot:15172406-Heterocapsa_arctica.AAC.1
MSRRRPAGSASTAGTAKSSGRGPALVRLMPSRHCSESRRKISSSARESWSNVTVEYPGGASRWYSVRRRSTMRSWMSKAKTSAISRATPLRCKA